MYKCYYCNHQKVHIGRKYQKEINQNNKCHIRMMGFIFSFHFQIFYDCVCQFYNYNYNYTTYKILAFYIRLLITTSFMIMEFYLGLK